MLIDEIMGKLRKGNLLELSATIQMAKMNGATVSEIEDKFIMFTVNLEEDIHEVIKEYFEKEIK